MPKKPLLNKSLSNKLAALVQFLEWIKLQSGQGSPRLALLVDPGEPENVHAVSAHVAISGAAAQALCTVRVARPPSAHRVINSAV